MKTVTDNLEEMLEKIAKLLQSLLIHHSSIVSEPKELDGLTIISVNGNFEYGELKQDGRQIQSKLLSDYRYFISLLRTLLREQPQDILDQLSATEEIISRTIEQKNTWCETTHEALDKAIEALQIQFNLVKNLYSPSASDVIFVPDTNALLYNTELDRWEFNETPSFSLVLTPTILSELDEMKINHRNEKVRKKAETLIREIKEFRNRGSLSDGVTLRKGKSTIFSIAIEPDMEKSLPWLDSTNNDDRFLTSVLEVMRLYPRSAVLAVSRDINFQNKADFAHIPFVEPPEPIPT